MALDVGRIYARTYPAMLPGAIATPSSSYGGGAVSPTGDNNEEDAYEFTALPIEAPDGVDPAVLAIGVMKPGQSMAGSRAFVYVEMGDVTSAEEQLLARDGSDHKILRVTLKMKNTQIPSSKRGALQKALDAIGTSITVDALLGKINNWRQHLENPECVYSYRFGKDLEPTASWQQVELSENRILYIIPFVGTVASDAPISRKKPKRDDSQQQLDSDNGGAKN